MKFEEEDEWTDEEQYAIVTNLERGLTVHPFPINPQDILDVGGHVLPDFEDLVESSNHGI